MAETQSPPAPAKEQKDEGLTDEVRRALEGEASGLDPAVVADRAERVAEYADFVAVEPIDYGGVRAYNVGDAVPKSNVEKFKYDDLKWVAKRTSKEGKAALKSIGVEEV